MFAVIDIETTGTRPGHDRITEIAVILHDGQNIVERFVTLINPECRISPEITRLTGINNEMVANAPKFYEVAKKIIELTENAVFVAHNVRFDYHFIREAYRELGYFYQRKTLCTVRLSRSCFPGLTSYSLGKLCQALNIRITDRHRAGGDAEATAVLFSRIVSIKGNGSLLGETAKTVIPPLLPDEKLYSIPESVTGVYYFHDKDGNVLYVGKAIDIRKRILQHFSMSSRGSMRSLKMKDLIADISWEPTGEELIALLLESHEIKRITPLYNVAQKSTRAIPYYGIFSEYDAWGYIRLYQRKLKPGDEPIHTADSVSSARNILTGMAERYNLCHAKCDLHQLSGPCFQFHLHKCLGACSGREEPATYNQRAETAISNHSFRNESFFLIGKGRHNEEHSVVCIENGRYTGFGYFEPADWDQSVEFLKNCIKHFPHNRDIQQILCLFLKRSHKKLHFREQDFLQLENR